LPSTHPTPAQIHALRSSVGLTQKQAGELLHTSGPQFQRWEVGNAKMNPAIFELFRIKIDLLLKSSKD
jgi:DNA-binding transcriptional regulator YiaG